MGYWPFIFGIICGVITDLIVKSGNYKSSKKNILSCGVFNLIIFGNFVPMFMNIEAYFSTRQSFGQEYITKMTDIFAIVDFPLPEGPTIAFTVPAFSSIFTPCRISLS